MNKQTDRNQINLMKISTSIFIIAIIGLFGFVMRINSSDALQANSIVRFREQFTDIVSIMKNMKAEQDRRYIELIKIVTATSKDIEAIKEKLENKKG